MSLPENEADEIKDFRNVKEEDLESPHCSEQLAVDKAEVAMNEEKEQPSAMVFGIDDNVVRNNLVSARVASGLLLMAQQRLQQQILASPGFSSPGFGFASPNFPFMMSPNYSAMYPVAPQMMAQNLMFSQLPRPFPMANVTNNMGNMQINPMLNQRYPTESPSTPRRERVARPEKKEKNRIKKPCNAFMIFMRENRAAVSKENKCKQSSELNKELGQRWQSMTKEEQEPYFELSKTEKDEHAKKYPNWSARENYAINKKKKRSKRERSYDPTNESNEQKKCRARFGVDNQEKWCKHCRRKKRCLNVQDTDVSSTTNPSTPSYHYSPGMAWPEPNMH